VFVRIVRTAEYRKWFDGLRDRQARARIGNHITKIRLAGRLIGDCKPVSSQVTEMRFHFGPGYRVYVTQNGNELLLLLAGGDKSSQQRDIRRAQQLADEWRNENGA